jgi:hypothetical protein
LVSRQRFYFNLLVLGAGMMLIVGAVAFSPGAVKGIGLGIGIGSLAGSLVFVSLLVHHRRMEGSPELRLRGHSVGLWSVLGGAIAGFATWEIVQASVFVAAVSRWLTLANGLVIASLACGGLVANEVCTERVIHVLEVVERPPRGLF